MKTDLSNTKDSLKDYALSLIKDLEEEGYDLTEGPWALSWHYNERPDIKITLIIGDYEDVDESEPGELN